ncbi:MAG: universal stress protein [Bacteroidota bacterium]
MKTIIAPTDFTTVSLNAVNYAADMAIELNARLLLMHVVTISIPTIQELPVSDTAYFQENSEKQLNDLKTTILHRTNKAIEVSTLQLTGNFSYELKKTCLEIQPFAIVMGSHMPGMLERLLFGSATLNTMVNLPFSVMVIPGNLSYKPIKKIAFATDLKGIYNIPLEEIKTITRSLDASLSVVHVALEGELAHESYAEKTLLQHRLKEFNPHFHFIHAKSVEAGIEKFTAENSIDLLLLLPKKHNLFHKSQSKQVIFHLTVPAMAIHEE